MRNLLIAKGLFVLAVLAFAASVRADTMEVVTATPIPLTPTDWSSGSGTVGYLTFPKFDPSQGTLDSVTLNLTGTLQGTALTVENVSGLLFGNPVPSIGTAYVGSTFTVSDPASPSLLSPELNVQAGSAFGPLSGVVTGQQYISQLGAVTQTAADSSTYTSAGVLSEFSGAGTISLSASTSTSIGCQYSPSGGVTVAFASQGSTPPEAGLTGTVIYTYTAVPEPSALALLGVGFLGLAGYAWRSRRRRRNA